ncbi:MAG: hypothetical protein IJ564_02015 [Alphaproteobacteria bacterium]|nr:hypothetical protein [Alphaproteobacteria bacterium]
MPFGVNLKYILSTIKSSFLPALIFALGLFSFYACNPYELSANVFLHYAFLGVACFTICALYAVNLSKPFFSLLCGTLCFIIINELKKQNPDGYMQSYEYLWICMLLPFNLLLFYFIPQTRLKTRRNFYLFLAVLSEAAFAHNFGGFISNLLSPDLMVECMPVWGLIIWVSMLAFVAVDISFKNTITNTGLFYADSCLLFGLMYSDSFSGFAGFFLCFALISLVTALFDLYNKYRYDVLENVNSYQAYLSHAANKFPFKYTIGVFCIDNREKIIRELGYSYVKNLEQLVINQLLEMPYNITVYRYNASHFIMVFKNETARHVMEYGEEIRHRIAASEFMFSNNISVKITISNCISEKTRKDLNAAEVINRAYLKLQQHTKFNLNLLVKA